MITKKSLRFDNEAGVNAALSSPSEIQWHMSTHPRAWVISSKIHTSNNLTVLQSAKKSAILTCKNTTGILCRLHKNQLKSGDE